MAQKMKYFYELTISSSPHVHGPVTTQTVMRDVLIALVPAFLYATVLFGPRVMLLVMLSATTCVFLEWAYRKLMHKDSTAYDLSAMVTGVLLAYVCPVTIPYWCLMIGDFFAIIVVKQLFGGIGKNFVNPALAARAFLFSWPVVMSTWVAPELAGEVSLFGPVDAVTSATPLAVMHTGSLEGVVLKDLFYGSVGGCVGETSVLLLLLGGAYLLVRRVISYRIPLAYLATVALLTVIFPRGNNALDWMLAQLCSGGLMLGAIFMATDYVTSPVTKLGQVIFGIGCGVITVVIRYFGSYHEGVSYAILVMNICVPILDKIGRPRKFGTEKKGAAKA